MASTDLSRLLHSCRCILCKLHKTALQAKNRDCSLDLKTCVSPCPHMCRHYIRLLVLCGRCAAGRPDHQPWRRRRQPAGRAGRRELHPPLPGLRQWQLQHRRGASHIVTLPDTVCMVLVPAGLRRWQRQDPSMCTFHHPGHRAECTGRLQLYPPLPGLRQW